MVSFEVPLTFSYKIGEIPPAVYPQKLKEKNPESLRYDALLCTPTVLDKIPIASVGEDCINFFQNRGGGLVGQLDPSYTRPLPPKTKTPLV